MTNRVDAKCKTNFVARYCGVHHSAPNRRFIGDIDYLEIVFSICTHGF
jgi:hypothetical protein